MHEGRTITNIDDLRPPEGLKPVEVKQKQPTESKGAKDYKAAQALVISWPNPLASIAGEMLELVPEGGWRICTNKFKGNLDAALGRSSESGAYRIACNRLAIPDISQCEFPTLFWGREGANNWDIEWCPFAPAPHEIIMADGILDVIKGEVRPAPQVIYGPRITLPWNLYADMPEPDPAEFLDILEYAMPDPEIRRHFQELMGSILQPHVPLRGQITLWGVPHSGKTTIATAICCAPAGAMGFSAAQEAELVRDKWASILLLNRFVNLSDDSPRATRWMSFLKRYTAGSLLVEGKGYKPVTVVPSAKLVSTCNEIQELRDASGAAGMRLFAFRFDKARVRTKDVNQDRYMNARYWSTHAQRQAILGWLIEGLQRLHTRGHYDPPPQWEDDRKAAVAHSDPALQSLSDSLEPDKDSFTPTASIRSLLPPGTTDAVLSQYMRQLFPHAERVKKQIDRARAWGYKGVRLV